MAETEAEKSKQVVVLLIGPPGSGKSTFCDNVMRSSSRSWSCIRQDTIDNGKTGTTAQWLQMAKNSLKEGKSVFIDRCNLSKEQRSEFIKLKSPEVEVQAVVLEIPAHVCISRSVKLTGDEGILQRRSVASAVNNMIWNKELPKVNEGFSRIMFCYNVTDVQNVVNIYSMLGPNDSLRSGCFGLQDSDTKGQYGIVPTLAFPSISTADYQFDLEKASDIIVEKVEEFLPKLRIGRLVLVDLTHGSMILSLVKSKASQKNIDSARFFTYVGDITKLYSIGDLHCIVIANSSNWELNTVSGGVNRAIYKAAGPDLLQAATRTQAIRLFPGKTVMVRLPFTSPLHSKEGITHVIHVLGPNMNPDRSYCLLNDYDKGCRILREAYTSLFEGFLSIIRDQSKFPKRSNQTTGSDSTEDIMEDNERIKRLKGQGMAMDNVLEPYKALEVKKDSAKKVSKNWSSSLSASALELYRIVNYTEAHNYRVLQLSDHIIVTNDQYPMAQKHVLIIARKEGLDQLEDVGRENLQLLQEMHNEGMKWVKKYQEEDSSLIFRLGYHSVSTRRQLHLHVISQDFKSDHLKNKKQWNSFTSFFFRDSVDVLEDIKSLGKATITSEQILKAELRCHRCRSAHVYIPKLKAHIEGCHSPVPDHLIQNNRLLARVKTSLYASG